MRGYSLLCQRYIMQSTPRSSPPFTFSIRLHCQALYLPFKQLLKSWAGGTGLQKAIYSHRLSISMVSMSITCWVYCTIDGKCMTVKKYLQNPNSSISLQRIWITFRIVCTENKLWIQVAILFIALKASMDIKLSISCTFLTKRMRVNHKLWRYAMKKHVSGIKY